MKKSIKSLHVTLALFIGFTSLGAYAVDRAALLDGYFEWKEKKNQTVRNAKETHSIFQDATKIVAVSKSIKHDDKEVEKVAKLTAQNTANEMLNDYQLKLGENINGLKNRLNEHKKYARAAQEIIDGKPKAARQSIARKVSKVNSLGMKLSKDIEESSKVQIIRGRAAAKVAALYSNFEKIRKEKFNASSIEEGMIIEGEVLRTNLSVLTAAYNVVKELRMLQASNAEMARFNADSEALLEVVDTITDGLLDIWYDDSTSTISPQQTPQNTSLEVNYRDTGE